VALAAYLVEPNPQALAQHKHILDLHTGRCAGPRESVDHEADQRPTAETDLRGDINAVQELARLGGIEHRSPTASNNMGRAAHAAGWIGPMT
jgi:hypothetical protein